MNPQGKKKRRLYYLLAGTLAVSALGGGGALLRLHFIKQRAFQGRTDGTAAMDRGDYTVALIQLGKYLSRYPTDADILLQYSKARAMVEEPNGKNVFQAIGLYQRVLELRPGLPEAQDSLLELYYRAGYLTETLALANTILARTPSDVDLAKSPSGISALRIKARTLQRMPVKTGILDPDSDPEEQARRLARIVPSNLKDHGLVIDAIMRKGDQSRGEGFARAQVEKYIRDLVQAHPDDPLFVLLQSAVASRFGDNESAAKLARSLVNRPVADLAYTQSLVEQLNALKLYPEAFAALQQAVKINPDPKILSLWIGQLYQTNRLPQLLEQTAALAPAASGSNVEVIGMRALALVRLDRRPEAAQLIAALEKRGQAEPVAAHWAAALHAVTQPEETDPAQTIRILLAALTGESASPILGEELGKAYFAAGLNDKAIGTWLAVSRAMPSWSEPLVRLSQAAMAQHDLAEALNFARSAQAFAPEDHDALLNLIMVSASVPPGSSADAAKVLAQVEDFQKRFPKDRGLLPVKVMELAQSQQADAASEVIRSALAADPAIPESVLLSLASISEVFHLNQEDACFAASEKAHGLTANLAFARARWLNTHQRAPEALAFLDKARAAHADDVRWRSIWAAYLDAAGDPRAAQEWITLSDGNPKDVRLQWAAMRAISVQNEHAFLGRSIDRLMELLGKDTVSLRLMRATWLLQGDSTEKDAVEASLIAGEISRSSPQATRPHEILAQCYVRLGQIKEAINEYTTISDLQPDQPGAALDAARPLVSRDATRARQYIERATRSKLVTAQNLRQAASLLIPLGDDAAALALLEKADGAQPPADLVLASLYRQLHQLQKTDDICRRLLEKTPEPSAVAFCADFYASQGRPDDVKKTLALLDGMKLPAGAKELMLAEYGVRHDAPEPTLAHFQAAALAAPSQTLIWQQWAAYCLGLGRIDDALAVAEQATQKVKGPSGLEILRENAALLKQVGPLPETRPLLMLLPGAGGDSVAPVVDALRMISEGKSKKELPLQIAEKLRPLADKNPRILPLQSITLQFYIAAGNKDEAAALSKHVLQAFPNSVEALRLGTAAMGQAQQWDQAMAYAQEWQQEGSSLDAHLAIASLYLQQGNLDAARKEIQPFLDDAQREPEQFNRVIFLQAQILLAAKQPAPVEALLVPLLGKAPPFRGMWLSLARTLDDPTRAADWLEKVKPAMGDNLAERTALAQAWIDIGRHLKKPDFELNGKKQLEAIMQSPDAPVSAILAWAGLCESTQDWNGADQAYRQAIQKDPSSAIAHNNLAYVLVRNKGSLPDAQNHIAKALSLFPNEPAFLDTKASVLAAQKDFDGAITTLKEAQRLDPQNWTWHLNLFVILLDANRMADAGIENNKIGAAKSRLSPEQQTRYAELTARYAELVAKAK